MLISKSCKSFTSNVGILSVGFCDMDVLLILGDLVPNFDRGDCTHHLARGDCTHHLDHDSRVHRYLVTTLSQGVSGIGFSLSGMLGEVAG